MRAMRLSVLPLAVVLVASAAERASACGATPCAQRNDVFPADGSEGLPLNTELRVLYFGDPEHDAAEAECDFGLGRMRLVPEGQEEAIEVGTRARARPSALETWFIGKASAVLSAQTTYALQLELANGIEACSCEERRWTTVSTFTTGVDSDLDAPLFAGASALTFGERLTGSSDCGSSDVVPVLPEFDPPSDASPELRYNVYVDGEIEKLYVQNFSGGGIAEIFLDCGSTALATWTRIPPGANVELRAVDAAGNESASNVPIDPPPACSYPVPDTDLEPTTPRTITPVTVFRPDTGTSAPAEPVAAERIATRERPQCTLSPGARSLAPLWTGLLALAVCALRRRAR